MRLTRLAPLPLLALAARAAAIPIPAKSDLPPLGFGHNSLVLPKAGETNALSKPQVTKTIGPVATVASNNLYQNLSAENGVAVAAISPYNATFIASTAASFDLPGPIDSTAAIQAVGHGGTAAPNIGAGSIATAIGAGSGAGIYNTSANAASAAAILNPHATKVYLNSSATANSTTYNSTDGPITEAWAFSISFAYDDQGDYAIAWAWQFGYSSPKRSFTLGNSGGYAIGHASASSTGPYGAGPGVAGWTPFLASTAAERRSKPNHGKTNANAGAGRSSARSEVSGALQGFPPFRPADSASYSYTDITDTVTSGVYGPVGNTNVLVGAIEIGLPNDAAGYGDGGGPSPPGSHAVITAIAHPTSVDDLIGNNT